MDTLKKIWATPNLKAAGAVTIALVLASNLTASRGTIVQGIVMFTGAAVILGLVVPKI